MNCLKGHRKVNTKNAPPAAGLSLPDKRSVFVCLSLLEVELVAGLLLEDLKNGL